MAPKGHTKLYNVSFSEINREWCFRVNSNTLCLEANTVDLKSNVICVVGFVSWHYLNPLITIRSLWLQYGCVCEGRRLGKNWLMEHLKKMDDKDTRQWKCLLNLFTILDGVVGKYSSLWLLSAALQQHITETDRFRLFCGLYKCSRLY